VAHYLALERTPFFADAKGHLSVAKDLDSVQPYVLDWSDVLDAGETISTFTATAYGPTVDSSSSTDTTTTVTVSQTGGYVDHTVVTSDSRTLIKRLNIYPVDE
jgi:hypothetical protein